MSAVLPRPDATAAPVTAAAARPMSPNQRAWARFRRNRIGHLSLWVFVVVLVLVVVVVLVVVGGAVVVGAVVGAGTSGSVVRSKTAGALVTDVSSEVVTAEREVSVVDAHAVRATMARIVPMRRLVRRRCRGCTREVWPSPAPRARHRASIS